MNTQHTGDPMIKAFLSHSSQDKDSYVRRVAEQLGRDNIVYDEFTFEEGGKTLDEILKGMTASELFVLFLSNAALQSEWVKREILEAKRRASAPAAFQIFPIIIDSRITHADDRLPEWLKRNYNLKPIARSAVAARRIQTKLREISWSKHPQLKKRSTIFVGRNSALDQFEERIHDFDREKPTVIVASGFPSIGRRTFLHQALCKTGISEAYDRPTPVVLDRSVSIEDFLLKVNDLGLIDLQETLLSLSDKSVEDKINIIHRMMDAAYKSKEIIYLIDDGCVISYERRVTDWFSQLIRSYSGSDYPIFCVASRYRVHIRERPLSNKFHFVELSELNANERRRLFNQLLELYEVDLNQENFRSVCDLLTGFPDQALFAVDLLRDNSGGGRFIDKLPVIASYSTDKASALLAKYESDEKILDFIRFLAQFEVITSEFVFSIADSGEYIPVMESLISEHIVEPLGIDGETLRLNDIVRDYITRNRLNVTNTFSQKTSTQIARIANSEDVLERDSSEYIYVLKEALKKGGDVDPQLLMPSHYLRCMKDLYYNKGSLERVIELADIILQKEANLEYGVSQDIRYYLCLALAKSKDRRMLSEVQKIKGDEHTFLLGYYYRRCGRLSDALFQLDKIKGGRFVADRAKREIVQVLVQLEDWDAALGDAKENYEHNRWNLYHTQAYFNCLVNSQDRRHHVDTLRELISNLRNINSDVSNEMADIAEATFLARIDNNQPAAINGIRDCSHRWTKSHYPLLALCDIAILYRDRELLTEGIEGLQVFARGRHVSTGTFRRYQAFLLAFEGKVSQAVLSMNGEMNKYPVHCRERIVARLRAAAQP